MIRCQKMWGKWPSLQECSRLFCSRRALRAKNTLELPMQATELRWGVRDLSTNHCCPRNSLKNHPCWRWNTTANLQFTCFFVLCFCVPFCSITEQSRWENLSGWHNCSLGRCCCRIFSIPSLIFFAVFSNLSLCREVNVFLIEHKWDSHLIELLQWPGSYLAWKPANFSRVSRRFVPPMEPSCLDVSVWISSINLICNCAKSLERRGVRISFRSFACLWPETLKKCFTCGCLACKQK